MKAAYLSVISLAERLHRRTLEVLQLELAQLKVLDINAVQAMILLNIGFDEVTAKELVVRGCYHGTNISYNLKRLTESGYIEQARSDLDRRLILIRATQKGQTLLTSLNRFYEHVAFELREENIAKHALEKCQETLSRLDLFTSRHAGGLLAKVE